MWIRILLLQPWWVRTAYVAAWALASAFAAVAVIRYEHGSTPNPLRLPMPGIAIIALTSVGLAGLFAAVAERERHRYLQALHATATPAERSQAIAAVRRGPVPANPRVREAAGRLARLQLSTYDKNRRTFRVVYPLIALFMLTAFALSLVDHDRHGLTDAIIGAAFLFSSARAWLSRKRLQARLTILAPNPVGADDQLGVSERRRGHP